MSGEDAVPGTRRIGLVRALFEAAVLAVALQLALVALGVLPGGLRLHPITAHAVIALIAVRAGLRAGLGTAALFVCVHLVQQTHGLGVTGGIRLGWLPAALGAVRPELAVSYLLTGGVLGALSERHLQRCAVALERCEQTRERLARAQQRVQVLETARRELERRIVEPAVGIARVYDAARRLETLEEEEIYPAAVRIAAEHLEASGCAIYVRDGASWRRRACHGESEPPVELPDSPVVRFALRQRRAVSLRDLAIEGEGESAPQPVPILFAAPLVDEQAEPFAVLVVTELPLVQMTEATRRILDMIASWVGRAIRLARQVARVRENVVFDERLGVLRASYLRRRLEEELARARRYDTPLSLAVLAVARWERVPEAEREPLLQVLAETLRLRLRRVDPIFVLDRPGALAALLPHTPPAGARRALERVLEALASLELMPYLPPEPLVLEQAIAGGADGDALPERGELLLNEALESLQPAAPGEGEGASHGG